MRRVAEFGPPNALLTQDGPFRRIYQDQHRGDLETAED
jgi:ABC-type multidrug transport system fused ATPase/permease subunit